MSHPRTPHLRGCHRVRPFATVIPLPSYWFSQIVLKIDLWRSRKGMTSSSLPTSIVYIKPSSSKVRISFSEILSLTFVLSPSSTVTKLNDILDDDTVYNSRMDTLLADVFNLLSCFFLKIGKGMGAPATYSQLAGMRVSNPQVL
jgi:hypothetical protein